MNNPAIGNSNNAYNITCNYIGGNCNISIKGNGHMIDGQNIFDISNVSWNQINNPITKKLLKLNYEIINSSLADLATQLIYFWIDIPVGQIAGNYKSNFTIRALGL